MAEKRNVFTKSDDFKSEYSCAVVRVGELTPIEGSDFLARTDIFGTQIVVRKDQVKTGDLMIYAANETALCAEFLSANNLFEIGCRDMNSNADEVNAIMKEYEEKYKNEADTIRNQAKQIKSQIDSMTKTVNKAKKSLKKIDEKYDTYDNVRKADADSERKVLNEKIDELTKKSLEKTVEYTALKKKVEELVEAGKPIVENAKKLCGFFNKYGRVRCITLKGCPSFGFLFGIEELAKYCPEARDVNYEELVDQEFDTVCDKLFVKAYVPPVREENSRRKREAKANKKLKRFDRLVEGEFKYHYDSDALQKNMHCMSPDKTIVASVKIHGCVERSTIVNTKEYGDMTIGEIVDNKIDCHIKARDVEQNEDVYVSVDQFYMIPNDGEWYEIELEDGTKLTITGNNPVWLPTLNCYRRVDELKQGDYILMSE